MRRRYKAYQCKTYNVHTGSATPYHVTETNPNAYLLIQVRSAKCKIDIRESVSQREDVSAGRDVEQGANLANSLLILNTLGQSAPIHPIGLPPHPPFGRIITDLNGTKKRRRR